MRVSSVDLRRGGVFSQSNHIGYLNFATKKAINDDCFLGKSPTSLFQATNIICGSRAGYSLNPFGLSISESIAPITRHVACGLGESPCDIRPDNFQANFLPEMLYGFFRTNKPNLA